LNRLEEELYRRYTSLHTACEDIGLDIALAETPNLTQCAHCGIWERTGRLVRDLDNDVICTICVRFVGL
jgi:hypothetical protein